MLRLAIANPNINYRTKTMQFLQKEWVENQPTPTFDKEPVKRVHISERMVLFLLGTYFTAPFAIQNLIQLPHLLVLYIPNKFSSIIPVSTKYLIH